MFITEFKDLFGIRRNKSINYRLPNPSMKSTLEAWYLRFNLNPVNEFKTMRKDFCEQSHSDVSNVSLYICVRPPIFIDIGVISYLFKLAAAFESGAICAQTVRLITFKTFSF